MPHSSTCTSSHATCALRLPLRLRLRSLLLFLSLFLLVVLSPSLVSVSAQATDPPTNSSAEGNSTDGNSTDGNATSTSIPTPTLTNISSSTGTGTGSNSTNTTAAPTATPTISNSTAPVLVLRNPNSTRAVCYGNPVVDAYLAVNDTTPWKCPRPDVDGGVLGPRNNVFPSCGNFTNYLVQNGFGVGTLNSTADFRPLLLCPQNTLASGLNLTASYTYTTTTTGSSSKYAVPVQVTQFDPYPVMLITANALYNKKMLFMPKVDEFTQLEVAASHGLKYFSVPNTGIALEAGGMTTGGRNRTFRVPAINDPTLGLPEGDQVTGIKYNYYGKLDWSQGDDPGSTTATWRYGVVPFWTVLINADNGVINDIHFDEGCDACADQLCSPDNNCGVTEYSCTVQQGLTNNADVGPSLALYPIKSLSDCAYRRAYEYFEATAAQKAEANMTDPLTQCPNITLLNDTRSLPSVIQADTQSGYVKNSTDCSIKVYVGWTGTDKNGKYFTSAGKRLSVFRKYSIGAAYNSATSFANNALPAAPTDAGQTPQSS